MKPTTIAAKLLRQTGLYNQIFGTNKGINLAGFDTVKTMGEFIFKLTIGNVNSPSEFYKNNLKGDLESYNEIKALERGAQFKGDKKTVFDMYKLYPKSIETDIFGQEFKNVVAYMRNHNIPLSLKEVPVNGNDLMELGYAGKQIGEIFLHLLKKIYAEQLPNEREAIINYIKSSKPINESIYNINADDYKSIDDSTLEKQINVVINFKDKSEDGKAIYISHEDLYEIYGYAYFALKSALKSNEIRVRNILGKYTSTSQAKFFENLQVIAKHLKNIGLLK